MRKSCFSNVAAYAAATVCVTAAAGCGQGNLAWTGPKDYDPPPVDTIFVNGFGVDDTVHVFAGPTPFSVQRSATNTGNANVAAGYLVRERILRYTFQVVGGTVGWAPGDTLTQVVYLDTVAGPALAPGASAPITFDSIPALPCGLYREQLLLDLGGTVNESNETDNIGNHFFFVPSPQQFNILLDTLDNQLVHTDGPTATYRFRVLPNPTVTTNPAAYVILFSFQATDGSTAAVAPVPIVPVPPGPNPVLVTMTVTPNQHNPSVPPPSPQVTGKLSVVSADGCIFKSKTASVFIEHG